MPNEDIKVQGSDPYASIGAGTTMLNRITKVGHLKK